MTMEMTMTISNKNVNRYINSTVAGEEVQEERGKRESSNGVKRNRFNFSSAIILEF